MTGEKEVAWQAWREAWNQNGSMGHMTELEGRTARAAFDGGESPAWECPDCRRTFVRETGDASHSLDLYGRDPPQ